jgi:hypothetical protein
VEPRAWHADSQSGEPGRSLGASEKGELFSERKNLSLGGSTHRLRCRAALASRWLC